MFQRIFERLLMIGAKNYKNQWMCIKVIASQTCDIFETQCIFRPTIARPY